MKNTIRTILCTAYFAVLAVSCQKGIEEVEPVSNTIGTIEISINGLMGEYTQVDATKASLVNTVRVAWEGGESVYVYDETSCLGYLASRLDGNDNRYAILSGTIDKPAGNKLFLVYSPLLDKAPAIDGDGKLSVSLAEQTTSKAPFVVFATLDYSDKDITGVVVPFSFATSVVRVSCIGLEPNTAISSAEISNVNTSCVLSFADGTVSASGAEEGTVTRLNADGFDKTKVNDEGDASFQFAVPALSTSTGRTLTVKQGGNKYEDGKFSKASIATNLSVNTICSMVSVTSITADSPVGTIGMIDGRKARVMDLCGTKYAVALRNEGATSDGGNDSYGSYYSYADAAAFFHGSNLNVWRVPTMDEMKALTDMPREYDSITPAIEFRSTVGAISFPLAGSYSSEVFDEVGNGLYYTSTPLAGAEGDIICIMHYQDGQTYAEYVANANPSEFKLSLRLFYQLTETDNDVVHGRFTVNSAGEQVYFSNGNLFCDISGKTPRWDFFDKQYELGPATYDEGHNKVISLFTWGYNAEKSIDPKGEAYDNVSRVSGDLTQAEDWGSQIGDGNTWRTLTDAEWCYLFEKRKDAASKYGYATVGGVHGIILLPDIFTDPNMNSDCGAFVPSSTIGWNANVYTTGGNWEEMEAAGAVFLPAAGGRGDSEVLDAGDTGLYWSSSASVIDNGALCERFNGSEVFTSEFNYRNLGHSVRLVTDCK